MRVGVAAGWRRGRGGREGLREVEAGACVCVCVAGVVLVLVLVFGLGLGVLGDAEAVKEELLGKTPVLAAGVALEMGRGSFFEFVF